MTTKEIENVLQQAPCPQPPEGLQRRLHSRHYRAPRSESPRAGEMGGSARSWLRRWWPALAPAGISLACAAVLTWQQDEIDQAKTRIEAVSAAMAASQAGVSAASVPGTETGAGAGISNAQEGELQRLRSTAQALRAEVTQLEQLREEVAKLRNQVTALKDSRLTSEEIGALEEARSKAQSIHCINNLKQLGLAVRVWANDNGGISPAALLEMTNEMASPKILVCPAESGRQAAADWASYTAANCSYEYLAPGAPETEPQRVLFRCPIHGHIGLVDGSVQAEFARNHPGSLVTRNGKLYAE